MGFKTSSGIKYLYFQMLYLKIVLQIRNFKYTSKYFSYYYRITNFFADSQILSFFNVENHILLIALLKKEVYNDSIYMVHANM
ncbi:MAG: hypothetical protein AYK18_18005 [Theionarchaea archaeon DG-70]|nr:MAG: hypothetical protein AYK18_18005 [Theionarchaea archaeon DG-70]